MKFVLLVLCLVFTHVAKAQEAVLTNMVLEAIEAKLAGKKTSKLAPIIDILDKANISEKFLKSKLKQHKKIHWLPAKDFGDILIGQNALFSGHLKNEYKAVAIHLYKVDVIEDEDDFFNDDIYLFYVATDGIIPTGKITNTYKGNDSGDSFLLTPQDRQVYPVTNEAHAVPSNHLIVDYSLIESDGDDIEEMKKISRVIVDLAVVAYSISNPEQSTQAVQLRAEVKKLTEVLLERNDDDQHFTDSLIFQKDQIDAFPSIHEMNRTHSGSNWGSDWKYKLHFRLLKI